MHVGISRANTKRIKIEFGKFFKINILKLFAFPQYMQVEHIIKKHLIFKIVTDMMRSFRVIKQKVCKFIID